MKKLSHFYLIILLAFIACKSNISQNLESKKAKKSTKNYLSFGDTITLENVLTEDEMLTTFNSLQMGDTLAVKFASTINDVCTKKGCWMKVSVAEKETLIRFKNYDFFVPKDAKNKKVIVEGKAFLKITSVKELQHYGSDAGKSNNEIANITKPEKSFAFVANGVLLKK